MGAFGQELSYESGIRFALIQSFAREVKQFAGSGVGGAAKESPSSVAVRPLYDEAAASRANRLFSASLLDATGRRALPVSNADRERLLDDGVGSWPE
jgi:hypothetical protein